LARVATGIDVFFVMHGSTGAIVNLQQGDFARPLKFTKAAQIRGLSGNLAPQY
jgi:hypothetical protein